MRSSLRLFLIFSVVAILIIEGAALLKRFGSSLPWTQLDLAAPPGPFTAAKIASLGDDAPHCRALLAAAGSGDRPAPARLVDENCGYRDGMQIADRSFDPAPAGLVTSCPVAAALLVWEREIQLEAQRLLGTTVTGLVHAGSFSCRRLYGRTQGEWSEHSTADAVDILGFDLANGRRLSVLRDWPSEEPSGRFLRAARTAACASFTTVLSPDYNEAHRDHLHFDTADRGPGGWRACR